MTNRRSYLDLNKKEEKKDDYDQLIIFLYNYLLTYKNIDFNGLSKKTNGSKLHMTKYLSVKGNQIWRKQKFYPMLKLIECSIT